MTQLINTLIALAMSLLSAGSAEAPAHDHDHDHDHHEIETVAVVEDAPGIYGADAATETAIELAFDRFAEAGLPLPELRIYVHSTVEGCQGHPGLFNADYSGHRLDLCGADEMLILHELAHAWEHHFVSDETREAFLDWSGKPVWNDGAYEWGDRGIEIAASVVAFGLLADDLDPAGAAMAEIQLEGYSMMTGAPSPRLP